MSHLVDVTSPNYHKEIYDRYRLLREEQPVYFDAMRNIWMITRYDDVRALLRNTTTAQNGDTGHSYLPALTNMDGEAHRTLRAELMPFFSQAAMQDVQPRLTQIVADLFEPLPSSGEVELLNSVIQKLPQRFVTELLGFPIHLADTWFELGDQLVGVDPHSEHQAEPQVALECLDNLQQLFKDAVQWKRKNAQNDFFSWLASEATENKIGEEGIVTLGNNIGLAALDTTINVLGNGTGLLACNSEQRWLLLNNPQLMPNAIEEMLRAEAPTQALPRRLLADIELHGIRIPAGAEISLVFASANHDTRKYPNPERFDIQRRNHDHLALGFGVHKCVGQHLARIEAHSYFTALLTHFPNFELVEHRWLLSHWARGYAALSIKRT